jgi:hypothetical protein
VILEDKCFSHHGSDPLADGHAHDAFDVFRILEHGGDFDAAVRVAASQLDLDRSTPPPGSVIDMTAALAVQAARQNAAKPASGLTARAAQGTADIIPIHRVAHKAPPEHLLNPPGVVGDAVAWVLAGSQKPQPLLAVGAMLAMFGTVLGQKVQSETGLRTNLYVCGVAGSGRGKDRARVAVRRLLEAAGMDEHIGGDDFASGQGLLARVARVPNSIFLPDEFGMLIETIGGKNAASFERSVMKTLLTLYNSTETTVRGAERADQKLHARSDAAYPCVNMYGVTTPDRFYKNLTSLSIADGWLNRILVLTAPPHRPPKRRAHLGEPPEAIISWIKAARSMAQGVETGRNPAYPDLVRADAQAEGLLSQWDIWIEAHSEALEVDPSKRGMEDLWARSWEITVKIAMIIAIGTVVDHQALREGKVQIDEQSARWAIDFVRHFMLAMEDEVSTRVVDSEGDRIAQDTLRFVRQGQELGQTKAELNRSCRSFRALADNKRQLAVLELLQAREEVVRINFRSGTRIREAWVAIEFAAEQNRPECEAA